MHRIVGLLTAAWLILGQLSPTPAIARMSNFSSGSQFCLSEALSLTQTAFHPPQGQNGWKASIGTAHAATAMLLFGFSLNLGGSLEAQTRTSPRMAMAPQSVQKGASAPLTYDAVYELIDKDLISDNAAARRAAFQRLSDGLQSSREEERELTEISINNKFEEYLKSKAPEARFRLFQLCAVMSLQRPARGLVMINEAFRDWSDVAVSFWQHILALMHMNPIGSDGWETYNENLRLTMSRAIQLQRQMDEGLAKKPGTVPSMMKMLMRWSDLLREPGSLSPKSRNDQRNRLANELIQALKEAVAGPLSTGGLLLLNEHDIFIYIPSPSGVGKLLEQAS